MDKNYEELKRIYSNKQHKFPKYNFKIKKFNNINKYENNNDDMYISEKEIKFEKIHNIESDPLPLEDKTILNKMDNFILVVDFPDLGGGTAFFLNAIILKYKKNNKFIIARNFEDNVYLSINDDYIINKKYNIEESVKFLELYKNKISKIFVNHIMDHSKEFLEKIFDINKNTILITHDYYSICNISNPYIHEIQNLPSNVININKYDTIITQNENNLFIFQNYIDENKEINIVPLPDYRNPLNKIETNNKKIIIGIIGFISDIKGRIILEQLINYYKNNKEIEIIVFGMTKIKNFDNYMPYNNIKELNDLLISYKPNILIETSLSPETYSYTLTLAMITQLPIIYLRKTGRFTVENRLSKYDKAFPFATIEELYQLVLNNKQDYFYTIEPNIYFNSYWNKLFS